MELNSVKSEVLHFCKSSHFRVFTVNSRTPGVFVEQKDPAGRKVVSQVDLVVKRAFGMLSFISQGMKGC